MKYRFFFFSFHISSNSEIFSGLCKETTETVFIYFYPCDYNFLLVSPVSAPYSGPSGPGSDSPQAFSIKVSSEEGVNVESLNAHRSNRLRTSAHNDVLPSVLHLITCSSLMELCDMRPKPTCYIICH